MRKFTADYLFTGEEMAEEGSVLVTTDEGIVEAILPADEAGEGIETIRGLLTPGFVNCHCHLELSHMKGLVPEKTGLVDFLLAVIRGRGAGQPRDMAGGREEAAGVRETAAGVQAAIAEAEDSMLHNGIVAVGDICNTSLTLPQKAEGRLYYHNFIETMGFMEDAAIHRFGAAVKVFQEFAEAYTLPIEANSLAPHAPYSVSPGLFQLIANFPGNHLLTIHNQETAAENQFCQTGEGDFLRLYEGLGLDTSFFKGTGKRSLASFLPYFYRNQTILLVHNVDTQEEDLEWLGQWKASRQGAAADGGVAKGSPNVFFCLCPSANLYISGQLPDINLLMHHDARIVLGTDSLASNHQLDILEEMKTLQKHFSDLSTATLLQWAISNGAKALQLDGLFGSFTPGKQPGVVRITDIENGRFTKSSRAQRLI